MTTTGTILHVDMSSRRVWRQHISEEMRRAYLGSRGINARILWEKMKPGLDPLSPDNVLIFGAGALSGSHAPSSGRLTITTKSPATNGYTKRSAGGRWGSRLKYAGYEGLVVYGAATTPLGLVIDDERVEFIAADQLWGMTVSQADAAIKEQLGADFETALIGPAGENLVKFSAIVVSAASFAARGGVGAVMGSKKLKYVAVRGSGSLAPARAADFDAAAMATREALSQDSEAKNLHAYGTCGMIESLQSTNELPSHNFQRGWVEGAENLGGQALVRQGYLKSRLGCHSCGISCHRFTAVDSPRYGKFAVHGPEYENCSALGSGVGCADPEGMLKANLLCNELGMDTISVGGVIQWAQESAERGVLSAELLHGLDLSWGNMEHVLQLIEMIAYRQGLGALLADGSKSAAEKLGHGSLEWAVQANGLEQSRVEIRSAMAYALSFAVNNCGPDHLCTECIAEFGLSEEARQLIKKITGDEKYADPLSTEKRAEIVRWHEDCYAVTDSLGFCAFSTTMAYGVTPENMAQMFSAATGIDMSETEIMEAGRRIVTLERAFNIREGFSRAQDTLPRRMFQPLPISGRQLTPATLDGMLDQYYDLHEWDRQNGWPKWSTFAKLGLEDVAIQLASQGIVLKQ